ncbi:hypothetical protein GCM10027073_63210 [Streptomyces chlorus]
MARADPGVGAVGERGVQGAAVLHRDREVLGAADDEGGGLDAGKQRAEVHLEVVGDVPQPAPRPAEVRGARTGSRAGR